MKRALVVFAKWPRLGRVKTRLAKDVGEARALEIYNGLLARTAAAAAQCAVDKYVYWDEIGQEVTPFSADIFNFVAQRGEGLGERMSNVFADLFALGYGAVVLVGSDIPKLNTQHFEQAFSCLNTVDIVFGPAIDGGYYLVAMRQLLLPLFVDKAWSTDKVLSQSILDIESAKQTFYLLEPLNDVDTAADLACG